MYQSLFRDSRFFDSLLTLDEVKQGAAVCVRWGAARGCVRTQASRRPRRLGARERDPVQLLLRDGRVPAPDDAAVAAVPGAEGVLRGAGPAFARLRHGPTPEPLNRLCTTYAVSVRTVRRWCRFWRATFVTSRVWQAERGRFAAPVRAQSMPGALLGAFSEISDLESRVVAVLRLVSPIGGGAVRVF